MPTLKENIHSKLTTQFVGRELTIHEELSSTNEWALTQLDKDTHQSTNDGDVIIAEKQSAGKGRMGRKWYSPANGNLYMSIILYPNISPAKVSRLTLIAGTACNKALNQLTSHAIELKWPNDLYHNGKKIGGILSECHTDKKGHLAVVVGIGINIHFEAATLPAEIKAKATSLQEITGQALDRSDVAASILNEFEDCYQKLDDTRWGEIISYCNQHNVLRDKPVEVVSAGKPIKGRVLGLSEEGYLIIQDESGREHSILEGDATICS